MNKPPNTSVTGAELSVLEELWDRGESSIGELRDSLYPDGGASKFATVQKLLDRLVAKGLVARRKDKNVWIFYSLVQRDSLIGEELRRVAERLGGSSMAPLLTYLVESGDLTAHERAHLRQLLDDDIGQKDNGQGSKPQSAKGKRKGR